MLIDDPSSLRGSSPLPSRGTDLVIQGNTSDEHDEPEVDYDHGSTYLYQQIEGKNWDRAIARIDAVPFEAKTWVCRREISNSSKIRWRLLPLHATCVFRSPLSVIEALIAAYPDGPQMRDDQSMLPVHLACRNGASKGVILTLLNAFPESICIKDRKDRTPYDFVDASQSQNREAVIFALKKFNSDFDSKNIMYNNNDMVRSVTPIISRMMINEVDYEHRTILFRLVLKKDWSGAVQRSKYCPDEAKTWIVTKGFNGSLRFLPLHKACVLQPPADVVEALIEAFPDGTSSKDQDGWLPIHCACFYCSSVEVVNALLMANPKCAIMKDDDGRLPLHYACLKGAKKDIVSALIRANPKAAMSKDNDGRLPIHHACSNCAPEETIEELLKSNPKGAQSKDDQGRLPLHHACRKNGSERTIRSILKVFPHGSHVNDYQEKLPIHYACQNISNNGMINALLEAYPESIHTKNGFGYTLLEETKTMENSNMLGVIEVLEKFRHEQDENTQKKSDIGVSIPSHEAELMQLTERVKYLEIILGEISKIGTEIKTENFAKSGKDASKAVNKLAKKFSEICSVPKTENMSPETYI